MNAEAIELRRIRSKLAALDGAQWFRSTDERGDFVEAKTRHGELNEIARFHPGAQPEEIDFIVSAPEMVEFLLRLVDRAIAAMRPPARPNRRSNASPPDYTREAAMKSKEPAFKVFLEERYGLERPLTDERTNTKLRFILRIHSKKQLNAETDAADRWIKLRDEFSAWKGAGL